VCSSDLGPPADAGTGALRRASEAGMAGMEGVSIALFSIGTMVLVLAFAASVGHAVLLASGRRTLAAALRAPTPQAAWAGVATGSFVESRDAVAAGGPADYAAPTPLGGASRWLTLGAFVALAASMVIRGVIVGRGP